MFSIQGFLTCMSKLPDELQTPQPDLKVSDSQPYDCPAQHHADCATALMRQVHNQSRAASQCQV
jgi:hypothetical protein